MRLMRFAHLPALAGILAGTVSVPLLVHGQEFAKAVRSSGHIPEGLWVLNRARSEQLQPADQTLWIIKDDGRQLAWVLVSTDDQKRIQINSWNGTFDGPSVPVMGSG